MNVLINATSAVIGGGVTVLRQLLPALLQADEGRHRYLVAARAEVAVEIDPQDRRVTFEIPRLLSRPLWEQVSLPRLPCDVLFSPANVASFASRAPQVLLFQNAAPFDKEVRERADGPGRLRLEALRGLGIASAQRASRVVFLSEQARALTLPQLFIAPGKTSVVQLGSDPSFAPGAGDGDALCVSQLYFYKNIVELIEAFALALPQLPADARLAIAGAQPEPAYTARIKATIARLGVGDRVRLLGNVLRHDLPALYAKARLFLFPSTCESFPNILLEALASGLPSIVSKRGPMEEIAGDAAVYVDPFDVPGMAAEIVRLWQDEPARAELRRRAIKRSARFSWLDTGKGILRALEEAAA